MCHIQPSSFLPTMPRFQPSPMPYCNVASSAVAFPDQCQLSPGGDPMAMLYVLIEIWSAALASNCGCTVGARQSYSEMMCEFMPLSPPDYDQHYAQAGPKYRNEGGRPVALRERPPVQSHPRRDGAPVKSQDQVGDALDVVLQSFDQVAGGDGYFNREELLDVIADPATPATLRKACQILVKNPSLFHALDQAADKSGKLDGRVGLEDLRAGREEWRSSRESSDNVDPKAEAARTVMAYFFLVDTAAGEGKRDQKLSKNDLRAVIENLDLPRELRESAECLLKDEELYTQLDTANGGKADGVISRKDLQIFFQSRPESTQIEPSMGSNPAVAPVPSVIVETSPVAQPTSPQEASCVAEPTSAPVEASPVAAPTSASIEASPVSQSSPPDPGRSQVDRSFQVLEASWESLGLDKLDREKAAALACDPNVPEDTRRALTFLLDNPALFNALDCAGAKKHKLDGAISLKDLQKGRQEWEATANAPSGDPYQVLQKYAYLLDTASGRGEDGDQRRDHKMSIEDLDAIASNPGLPLELRQAASTIRDNQEMMNKADTGDDSSKTADGIISVEDLSRITGLPSEAGSW